MKKMAEEEENNFNCHMSKKKNTGKKNGRKGKTTISIFTREEKWRERKEDNLNIQEVPCPHFN